MHLRRKRGWLLGLAALLGFIAAAPAHAVRVSATHINPLAPHTNTMSLAPKLVIFDPGTPAFIGAPSLTAPAAPGSVSDTVAGFTFGTPSTAVQISGDAISSITRPGPAPIFNLDLTLTNFSFSSISLPANEYVYVNLWETFTSLPIASTASWTGVASITGSFNKTSLGDGLFIEPIVTAYDATLTNWVAASTFFGGLGPGLAGPIAASTPVASLSSYIDPFGNLSVGYEFILGLNNADVIGGDLINLPTSLELKLRYDASASGAPVPGPLSLLGAPVAYRFSRHLRRRCGPRRSAARWGKTLPEG